MQKTMKLAIATALAAWAIVAYSQGAIFRQHEVTEEALINALSPRDSGARTRSIQVRPNASTQAARKPVERDASVMITFETDSADLSPDARSALDVIARALHSDRLASFRFTVEGHADPRGAEDYNLRLSQARAESVVTYLIRNHQLDSRRLTPIGKGDRDLARPDVPTAPENRRVTLRTRMD